MNEPAKHRLGCTRTPEPDIRLRKGHQLDDTRGSNNDNYQGDLEPSLETPVCSSYYENSPEEPECHDDNSQEDEGFMGMSPLLQAHHAMERMEEFVCKVWEGRWRVIPHDVLPDWLKDNDFLLHGHRPPMPSFRACFKSIFRIHTETGNIWTHLLGVFVGLGLSGIIPTLHYVISEGFLKAATIGQIGWLMLMASLYITGAALYAARIPERFFPGKCDIWFHSHQLFHIFVVAGAFVHFHGVSNLQEFRFMIGGGCTEEDAL